MIHSGKVLRGSGDSFKSPPAFFFLHRKKSLQFPEECAIINALQAQPAQEAPQAGKQKERRKEKSISLSRTWYIRDCKLTVNISDSTKGSAIHQY